MIYFGEIEGELLLPAVGNHLLQQEGCRIMSELELGLLRVRRSVEREGGSTAELCLAQTAGFGEVSAPGFSRWEQGRVGHGSPVGEAGASSVIFLLQPPRQQDTLGDASLLPLLTPVEAMAAVGELASIPKLLQVMPWTVWHTRPWPEGCCVLSYAHRPH